MVAQMDPSEWLLPYWQWIAGITSVLLSLFATVHIVLYKRDTRAAIGWIGLVWLAPITGNVLYFLLGINRIQRKAHRLRRRRSRKKRTALGTKVSAEAPASPLSSATACLESLVRLVGAVTKQPLLAGNRIATLHNGDQAYPAMLHAIQEAKQSVGLSSYIFDNDRVGALFVDALQQAVARGIQVRVMIDDIGSHYTWNSIYGRLRHAGIPATRFLPKLLPRYFGSANLCNHRKLVIVDGRVGFTGGINISEAHNLSMQPRVIRCRISFPD